MEKIMFAINLLIQTDFNKELFLFKIYYYYLILAGGGGGGALA